MDSGKINLQMMTETCSVLLGTVLGAGWLPSAAYHLTKGASHGHPANSHHRQNGRKVRDGKGQAMGTMQGKISPAGEGTFKAG